MSGAAMLRRTVVALIRFYSRWISPLKSVVFGQQACCRFTPSCSHYAAEACELHGVVRGAFLTLKRILRCHPWGGYGSDPVPPRSGTLVFPSTTSMRAQQRPRRLTPFVHGS